MALLGNTGSSGSEKAPVERYLQPRTLTGETPSDIHGILIYVSSTRWTTLMVLALEPATNMTFSER
jgi:hypothetical protein